MMKHFKEEIIRDIFNDAVVVTTKEHYYYASDSEKKQHKIDMINHGEPEDNFFGTEINAPA